MTYEFTMHQWHRQLQPVSCSTRRHLNRRGNERVPRVLLLAPLVLVLVLVLGLGLGLASVTRAGLQQLPHTARSPMRVRLHCRQHSASL